MRGVLRKVQFVTAQARSGELLNLHWPALADTQSTLAVYMGRPVCSELAGHLIQNGLAADLPVLVTVNVSLPTERLLRTRLDLLGLSTALL